MPPVPKSRIEIMKGWIEPYEPDFKIINENELYCVKCNKLFKCSQKQHLVQHINTQAHMNEKVDNFNDDLCEAFAAANIPLNKLQNPVFKSFLEKYMNRKIPDESTVRKKSVTKVYTNIMQEIKSSLNNKYIWASVDETTDDMGRRVVNVIVGALEVTGPTQPFLIATRFFDTVNADIITTVVSDSINHILQSETQQNAASRVLLLVTDAAAYMLKAGQQLKLFFPNLLHITCLAHALHRICEFIRNEFADVDFFVSRMKKIFLKAHSRIVHYRDMCPDLPLPPQPVTTRWGTWLQAVIFYAEHFLQIWQTVLTLKDDARSVQECQRILTSENLLPQLQFIKEHFSVLVKSIKALEERGTSVSTAISDINNTISLLKTIPGDFGHRLSLKIDSIFEKNPDLSKLIHFVTYGPDGTSSLQASLFSLYTYAPVTSCDVERSFSAYKDILTRKRQQFTEENIEKMLAIYVNRKVFQSDDCC